MQRRLGGHEFKPRVSRSSGQPAARLDCRSSSIVSRRPSASTAATRRWSRPSPAGSNTHSISATPRSGSLIAATSFVGAAFTLPAGLLRRPHAPKSAFDDRRRALVGLDRGDRRGDVLSLCCSGLSWRSGCSPPSFRRPSLRSPAISSAGNAGGGVRPDFGWRTGRLGRRLCLGEARFLRCSIGDGRSSWLPFPGRCSCWSFGDGCRSPPAAAKAGSNWVNGGSRTRATRANRARAEGRGGGGQGGRNRDLGNRRPAARDGWSCARDAGQLGPLRARWGTSCGSRPTRF